MGTYVTKTNNGLLFVKGDLGDPCADCSWVAEFLCDFPVGDDKTCDRRMCEDHANRVSDDIHYCDTHFQMWKNYSDNEGFESILPARIIKIKDP